MVGQVPDFFYGDAAAGGAPHANRGLLTERGLKHVIACVEAMKDVLGDEVGLALDCGPGWMVPDAIRLAKALEPLNLMWLEDLITGDYTPYVLADVYREVTRSTSTPIHTGEQIYLRQNFKELIEKQAVNIIGPDPADVGGIAELKWVAEYADLHGILMAPHGIFDGLIGLAALVQVCATLPQNYIAFEYPVARPDWWYDIVDGLPDPIVKDSMIEVWDRPGLGVEFNVDAALKYLSDEDADSSIREINMNVRDHNRKAWDKQVEYGNEWTVPVTPEQVAAARQGTVTICLTSIRPVPQDWLGSLPGKDVLCLASGGGQQGPHPGGGRRAGHRLRQLAAPARAGPPRGRARGTEPDRWSKATWPT